MDTENKTRGENVYAAPDTAPALEKKKKGFRFVELAIVLVILFVLVAMLFPVTRGGHRGPARRTMCLNNLRQITLAMINYESANGHFLPAYIAD